MSDIADARGALKRLIGLKPTTYSYTDNAIELGKLLQRIGREEYPPTPEELAADLDHAIELANEMRAAINTLTDSLGRIRGARKEAA